MSNQMVSKQFLLRLFLPFGLGYFVSYLFRTVNAVIAPDLVADLGLSAADLGLLTSAYFLRLRHFNCLWVFYSTASDHAGLKLHC